MGRPECKEDPSCTQLLLKWEIPRGPQTFDITSWDPSGAGISANPGRYVHLILWSLMKMFSLPMFFNYSLLVCKDTTFSVSCIYVKLVQSLRSKCQDWNLTPTIIMWQLYLYRGHFMTARLLILQYLKTFLLSLKSGMSMYGNQSDFW